MTKISDIFYQITAIPLHISLKKFFFKSFAKQKHAKQCAIDLHTSTYFQSAQPLQLSSIPFQIPISFLEELSETIVNNADDFCLHNFTYLGVSANHNRQDSFIPLKQNQQFVDTVSSSITDSYSMLDWQQDFQSSYRFSEHQWYKQIRYEYIHGVDAKNPIEFGRLQHLPHLIYAAILTNSDDNNHNKYCKEFQHQILDFIIQNPPRFGIQWLVTMDVGIRLFNIVVAYSIARSHSLNFDNEFEQILANSIVDHCNHIYSNLEWSSGMRGNHYLANLTGLLAGALVLPDTIPQKALWIEFASNQLLQELLFQFQDDGSNFEDSTCYHRLSAEIMMFGIALVLYAPKQCSKLSTTLLERIDAIHNPSSKYYNRIVALHNFSHSFLYDDTYKTLLQIGDDDSGQLCKLEPQLDIQSSQSALSAFQLLQVFKGFMGISDSIVSTWISELVSPLNFKQSSQQIPKIQTFSGFGLYRIYQKSASIFFHCNETLGQLGKGGHTHNDVLSILLSVNAKRILVDPGTFTYTPYPEIRNIFRSTSYHNTLSIDGKEQNILFEGVGHNLFWLRHTAKAKMLFCDEKLVVMEHKGYGAPHRREVQMEEGLIVGKDFCSVNAKKYLHFHFAPECTIETTSDGCIVNNNVKFSLNHPTPFTVEEYDYSPQYGIKVTAKRLKVTMTSSEIQWRIEW
jgi:hypothetical protein